MDGMNRRSVTLAAGLVVALAVFTPTASAKTIRLNWTERLPNDFGFLPMTFKVTSVALGKNAWAVRATVTNRSKTTIRVVPPTDTSPQQFGFGLSFAHHGCPRGVTCGLDVLRATYAKPALPRALPPGGSWRGTFGGPKLPPKGQGIGVTFGYFYVSRNQKYSFVTQHEFRR
jgi:hypothetical protein